MKHGSTSLSAGLGGLLRSFGSLRDPRLAVIGHLTDSVDPSIALLATVLGQDIGIGALARLLRELDARLGEKLLSVDSADWSELERACKFGFLAEWPHKDVLAGWVLSVADFLRAHGRIPTWKSEFVGGPSELVETMARELPWMGARSPSKIKGWRLARWVVRGEIPADSWEPSRRTELVLPVAAVERSLRTLGWLPAGWQDWATARRQEWLDDSIRQVATTDPASLWVPLEIVLSRGRSGPACQEHLGSCAKCPVRPDCPSPGRT